MTTLPHIGRTLRQRHRAPAQNTAPTAAERDLQNAIDRARHTCMFAAADDAPTATHTAITAASVALTVVALLGLVAVALAYYGGTP